MYFSARAAATIAVIVFAAPAFAEDLVFDLINSSSVSLHELYVAPHDSDQWGDDILGTDTLAAGETGSVTIADGKDTCDYDMRFVAEDGSELERNVDLCKLGSFTLTN
ncbi:MAG: hypothetical protein ACOH2M_17545 [Cypionkella sp.]